MRVPVRKQGKLSGFTLVEMAIVLVIIGIILAGVMKGRDIVRGAQVKQFSQQFAQKWGTIAQTYYDKTGQVLNDGALNGGNTGAADGQMDGAPALSAVRALGLLTACNNVGIPVCSLVKSKLVNSVLVGGVIAADVTTCGSAATWTPASAIMNPWQTNVEGEYSGTITVTLDLIGLRLTQNGVQTRRNLVVIYNVPADVAQGLDTAIDGKNDGLSGSCVCLATNTIAAGPTGLALNAATTATAWPAAVGTAPDTNAATVGIILDF